MKQKESIESMKRDLEAYRANSNSTKPLSTTMKEISEWLKTKEK